MKPCVVVESLPEKVLSYRSVPPKRLSDGIAPKRPSDGVASELDDVWHDGTMLTRVYRALSPAPIVQRLVEKLLAQVLRLAPQTPQQTVLVYRRVHEEENVHIYDIYMYVCVCHVYAGMYA